MTGLLLFNAPIQLRAKMWRRRQSDVLWMPLILYHLPDASPSTLESRAARLKTYFERKSDLTDMNGHLIVPMVHVLPMPLCLASRLHPTQREWMLGATYLQNGYYNEMGVTGIAASVACAMTLYDYCACAQGTTDPGAHTSGPASEEDMHDDDQAVRNYYRSGIGFWTEALAEHRTKVLVRARALLMRRDPLEDFEHFIDAGGSHFLNVADRRAFSQNEAAPMGHQILHPEKTS